MKECYLCGYEMNERDMLSSWMLMTNRDVECEVQRYYALEGLGVTKGFFATDAMMYSQEDGEKKGFRGCEGRVVICYHCVAEAIKED